MRRTNSLGFNDWSWEGENKSQNIRISDNSDLEIKVILKENKELQERTWLLLYDILIFKVILLVFIRQ